MLYKYAVKFGFDLTTNIEALDGFSDMPKISTWAVETMQWAVTQGIISGKTDTTLDPLGYATRAECAAMIMRLINKNSGTKPKVGDIMTIGHYEQDGVIENGKEPIEWQVLKVESNRVLLVSKYVLDYQWMDELNGFVRTWSSCNLRYWLNCDFKNTAFSSSEMARIPTVIIKPEINETFPEIPVGVDSYDKVFCLSMNELNELFEINYRASNNNPKYLLYSQYFIAAPTQYCKNRGAYEFTITENDYNYLSGFNYTRDVIGLRGTQWWTRTPGNISNNEFCYCYVSQYGESGEGYSIQTRQHFGVRPAIYYYY